MKRIQLSGSPLEVTRISLGTQYFGATVAEENAFDLLDCYQEAGGNVIDTALIYNDGIPGEKGRSEKVVGRWLRSRRCRDTMVICTKGAHPRLDRPDVPRLSREDVVSDLENSLKNLQLDHIDLYWLHRDDVKRDTNEIVGVLDELVRAGKIRFYGCSNWKPYRLREVLELKKAGMAGSFIANQVMWNLALPNRERMHDASLVIMDRESFSFHKETILTAFAYSSQAGGYFTKRADAGEAFSGELRDVYSNRVTDAAYAAARKLALEYGTDTGGIALAYLTCQQDFGTIAIIGPRDRRQLLKSLSADALALNLQDIQGLNTIRIES